MAVLPDALSGQTHIGGPTTGVLVPVSMHVASPGASKTDYLFMSVPATAKIRLHAFSWAANAGTDTTLDVMTNSTADGSGATSLLNATVNLATNLTGNITNDTAGTPTYIATQDVDAGEYLLVILDAGASGAATQVNAVLWIEYLDAVV